MKVIKMTESDLSSLGALTLVLFIFIFAFLVIAMILYFFILHNSSLHGIDQIHYASPHHFM